MANTAEGNHFSIATPHYKSTMSGMQEFLRSKQTASATLAAALSLSYNLPHLCGLGGDAIIIQKDAKGIRALNGTGKTGSGQCHDAYRAKGMSGPPRRGALSTMVYGCPYAYRELSDSNQIDLRRITRNLLRDDLAYGLSATATLEKAFRKASSELSMSSGFGRWQSYFQAGIDPRCRYADTLRTLARDGFRSLYNGSLGEQTHSALSAVDPDLYVPNDFSGFSPNPAEIRKSTFLDASVSVHGSNSPWRQLFLLLKLYENYAQRGETPVLEKICCAAAWIEDITNDIHLSHVRNPGTIADCANELFQRMQSPMAVNPTLRSIQAHTVFMACVEADGCLLGLTNSIFTPLGALFEINDTGILLSNRCFSFNQGSPSDFLPGVPARHTNNCVIVETGDFEFVIGTSGGPVQAQTLAYLIHLIVAERLPISAAIRRPRCANLGINRHIGVPTYLCEQFDAPPGFTSTRGLSDKFGVVQVAGRNLQTGRVFAAADPRGDGVALAI